VPWKSAKEINLSEKEEQILTEYAVGTHTPLHLKTRAQIILKAANGGSNSAIKREMVLALTTVRQWRDRYASGHEELKRAEAETPLKMRSIIKKILSDGQRPGSPATFTDEQTASIIALACEDPAERGLPFSHWTPGLLQMEAIKLGIVNCISVRQIGRFLKGKGFTAA
jgi:putative transposase